ncbi:hypothetical protein [Bosea sp. (in: a-proteobacteria)]|jgi:hypothetical protein|uniref:peptidoglycan-binding domain-containing protein n=1 Tax=Bosea sp. (in: a-proteobacteria) TaxID=1871050 RepID=UPI002DDD6FA8|nr:hypothetical protein [Bosea sp. (in: a-proteobacteria)]HEV2512496.1 hypothetical protein [Bosea sp. (in: a-proteobacteria)]
MTLRSFIFAGEKRLEACLRHDASHVARGASGEHVRLIQTALIHLDGAAIDPAELKRGFYGPSTARAVLAFKTRRDIVNRSYQKSADDTVGRMTIAALDAEMLASQKPAPQGRRKAHGPARTSGLSAEASVRRAIDQMLASALAKLR